MGIVKTSAQPLSILIPTLGRIDVLWNTLKLLLPQLQAKDEILIIDQNEPPLRLPREWINQNICILRQAKPSLTRARNLGLANAHHEHVLFLDDDIIPEPDLLEAWRKAIQRFPGCIMAGSVEQTDNADHLQGAGFINLKTGEIRTRIKFTTCEEVPLFGGGHVLIPKNTLPAPPHFSPLFKGSSQGEEIDLALRARKLGVKIMCIPEAKIFHLKEPSGGCRSDAFQKNFYLDQIFNEALFFARNGKLGFTYLFLWRIQHFIEFHTRNTKGGHSLKNIALATQQLSAGFLKGLLSRYFG